MGAFHIINRDVKKQIYEKVYVECNRNTISYFKPTFFGESVADVCTRLWNAIYFIKDYIQTTNIKNVFILGHGNSNKCTYEFIKFTPEFHNDFSTGKYNKLEI